MPPSSAGRRVDSRLASQVPPIASPLGRKHRESLADGGFKTFWRLIPAADDFSSPFVMRRTGRSDSIDSGHNVRMVLIGSGRANAEGHAQVISLGTPVARVYATDVVEIRLR